MTFFIDSLNASWSCLPSSKLVEAVPLNDSISNKLQHNKRDVGTMTTAR